MNIILNAQTGSMLYVFKVIHVFHKCIRYVGYFGTSHHSNDGILIASYSKFMFKASLALDGGVVNLLQINIWCEVYESEYFCICIRVNVCCLFAVKMFHK